MALTVATKIQFYVSWNDSRITFNKEPIKNINLGLKKLDKYFLPDFYIYNLLDFEQSKFAEKQKSLQLTTKGLIW